MSNVTSVIVLVGYDSMNFAEVNRRIVAEEIDDRPLCDVTGAAGGHKSMESEVWAGGFNYLDEKHLMSILAKAATPRSPCCWYVHLMIQSEQDEEGWRMYNLDERRHFVQVFKP